MSSSFLETSTDGVQHFIEFQELQPLHCSKDALTDFFGWLLQGLLAGIAFSCLIGALQLSTNSKTSIIIPLTYLIQSIIYSQKVLWAKLQTKTVGHLVVWHFQTGHRRHGYPHDQRLSFAPIQRRSMYLV